MNLALIGLGFLVTTIGGWLWFKRPTVAQPVLFQNENAWFVEFCGYIYGFETKDEADRELFRLSAGRSSSYFPVTAGGHRLTRADIELGSQRCENLYGLVVSERRPE